MEIKTLLIATSGTVLMFGCCLVNEPACEIGYPGQGAITLTMDWTNRTDGIDIPVEYTVTVGDYSAVLSGAVNTLDYLFDPGNYRGYIYCAAEHIAVNGTTATVEEVSGNAEGVGQFVHSSPGWFFSCAMDMLIKKNTDHAFIAVMRQQVRQLTLVIEPVGGIIDKIAGIDGYLSGVAGTLNFDDGTHGAASNVELDFAQITSGDDAGKWMVTVRLPGVTGAEQKLNVQIRFTDNTPQPITLESGLTTMLSGFNADKQIPLTLGSTVEETPAETGFTVTIAPWEKKEGTGIAN